MMKRRDVLRGMALMTGGLAFSPFLAQLKAEAAGSVAKLPKRFVFVSRSNGMRTYGIAPKGLEQYVQTPASKPLKAADKFRMHRLVDYALNDSMSALDPFRSRMNIINGLSAKMISSSHGGGFGALGANNGYSVAVDRTIDGALANTHPGVFKHLGFKLAPKTETKVERPSITAFGPKQPGTYYCDPAMAFGELFGSIATNKDIQARQLGDKKLLDFLIDDTKRVKKSLNATENEKLDHYLGAFETLTDRRVKLAGMTGALDRDAPEYSDKYTSEVEVHRLEAHFDMAAASLIAGLTNVVTLRCDALELHYHGLNLGHLNVHGIGHIEVDPSRIDEALKGNAEGKVTDGVEARRLIRKLHFDQVGALAAKLDAVPEGDGTMLDQTLIVVYSDHGAMHHPNMDEFPFITIGNVGGALKTGQYLHYPNTRYSDNRTIGSFYTALMHAAGAPCDGFGQIDSRLPENEQKEPLAEVLA